ncbi:MATE family efflux transporter [Campylobacter peloridis]|uniref:MATE family efflux transporter n=1 Tax=Campylobacter peloridis TaxID=488546 RepID=A0ABX6TUJ2_9BACT|nr:MATE family efflux transporter [Campylobacter peloridis]
MHEFYVTSNPTKLFLKCALPNMTGIIFIYLYIIVDGIFVGKYLGANALAAMNLMMPFITISFALADMIAIGSSVQISINLGKGKINKARRIFSFCLCLIFVISCIMGILGYFLANKLSVFLGANDDIQELCTQYMQVFTLFAPFIIISFAIDNYLRICGKTYYSMVANIIMAVVNIFLDWLFIVVFGWGLFSAALATCIGILTGVILSFIPFIFSDLILKFTKPIIQFKILKNIIYNGSSEFFSNISSSFYIILANSVLLEISGNIAVAAFSIILYLSTFTFALIIAMCDAMQPALSYNYGLKNIDRIKVLFKKMIFGSALLGIIVFLLVQFYHDYFIFIFNKDNNQEFIDIAKNASILFSFSFLFSWFGKFCASFFTALDKPLFSLGISITQSLIFPFIFLNILVYFLGLNGVWLATLIGDVLIIFIALFLLSKIFKNLNIHSKAMI